MFMSKTTEKKGKGAVGVKKPDEKAEGISQHSLEEATSYIKTLFPSVFLGLSYHSERWFVRRFFMQTLRQHRLLKLFFPSKNSSVGEMNRNWFGVEYLFSLTIAVIFIVCQLNELDVSHCLSVFSFSCDMCYLCYRL